MTRIAAAARFCFALSLIVFGVQHLVYGEFVTRVFPKLPAFIPGHLLWAYVAGLILLGAGAAIVFRLRVRTAATILGCLILLSFLLLYVPQLLVSPPLGGLWTNAGKALALAGGCFLLAVSLPARASESRITEAVLPRLAPVSPVFLSIFLILAGVQHFLFSKFVATLVPGWIPGAMFWTYFAAVALIAGGLGMLIPPLTFWAGLLSAVMIFLWVFLLHIPRALAAPHDSNETTAVFEALAFSATAFLVAFRRYKRDRSAL